jgi:hypothetical protein
MSLSQVIPIEDLTLHTEQELFQLYEFLQSNTNLDL